LKNESNRPAEISGFQAQAPVLTNAARHGDAERGGTTTSQRRRDFVIFKEPQGSDQNHKGEGRMPYIIEKKIGEEPHFYEDAWQSCWEEMKRKHLDFGELPPGYEAVCITQDQIVAAAAVITLFGANSEDVAKLRASWPHLDWNKIAAMYQKSLQ